MRALLIVLASAAIVHAAAQQTPPRRFDVASVKPAAGAPLGEPVRSMPGVFLPGGGRFAAGNAELTIILHRAYPEFAAPGLLIAPAWIADERFDIDARTGTDVPIAVMRLMLRQLLVDRFGMQSHAEMRQVDTYQLVLARADGKLGARLRSASGVCDEWHAQLAATVDPNQPDLPYPLPPQPKQSAGAIPCGKSGDMSALSFGGVELSRLTTALSGVVGRSVTDRTGLTGRFDIDLSLEDISLAPDDPDGNSRELATALEDQLGLKLQKVRGIAEVLVVDRIERPTAN